VSGLSKCSMYANSSLYSINGSLTISILPLTLL
jgi:hypothetical protein